MAAEVASNSSLAAVRSLYRTFTRELRRGSVLPRPVLQRRDDPLPSYVRRLIRDVNSAPPQRLRNVTALLQNARIHAELLARYNPTYGKSSQERIKATANRVGWDVPKEYQDTAEQAASAARPAIDAKYRS